LGAVDGGVTVNITIKTRDISVDGAYLGPIKGLTVLDTFGVVATVNMKEMTVENMTRILLGSSKAGDGTTAPATAEVITGTPNIPDSAYIENLGIIGKYTDGSTVLFIIHNALPTSEAKFQFKDQAEVSIPVDFTGSQTIEDVLAGNLPYTLIRLDDAPTTTTTP